MEKHPIICPNCDNRNITIITEYHKSLACRIVEVILFALIFWIAIEEIKSFLIFPQLFFKFRYCSSKIIFVFTKIVIFGENRKYREKEGGYGVLGMGLILWD